MTNTGDPRLARHQAEFVDNFVDRDDARTLLVAPTGTGKSYSAMAAAAKVLEAKKADHVLFVCRRRELIHQWKDTQYKHFDSFQASRSSTFATYAALSRDPEAIWGQAAVNSRWLFVFDEVDWFAGGMEEIVSRALERFPGSRALFIANRPAPIAVDARFAFDLHEVFEREALLEPENRSNLVAHAPSISLLEKVRLKLLTLDDLTWREFETLLAQMLETDGYTVELTQGSKDGGVDVIATRDLGDSGMFKAVWQAKKHRLDRKVGLSLVRELADTRMEHGASKAVIATTSFLTQGALARVERDRYLLGKVDRTDFDRWIERTLAKGL